MHGLSFTLKSWAKFLAFIIVWCAWPATWSDPLNHRDHRPYWYRLWAATRATRASTSVVFTPGLRRCILTAFTCFTHDKLNRGWELQSQLKMGIAVEYWKTESRLKVSIAVEKLNRGWKLNVAIAVETFPGKFRKARARWKPLSP